jgi:hypothetical protein
MDKTRFSDRSAVHDRSQDKMFRTMPRKFFQSRNQSNLPQTRQDLRMEHKIDVALNKFPKVNPIKT